MPVKFIAAGKATDPKVKDLLLLSIELLAQDADCCKVDSAFSKTT